MKCDWLLAHAWPSICFIMVYNIILSIAIYFCMQIEQIKSHVRLQRQTAYIGVNGIKIHLNKYSASWLQIWTFLDPLICIIIVVDVGIIILICNYRRLELPSNATAVPPRPTNAIYNIYIYHDIAIDIDFDYIRSKNKTDLPICIRHANVDANINMYINIIQTIICVRIN